MPTEEKKKAFEEANQTDQTSLLRELYQMLKHNKKFWMIPLIAGLLLFGLLVILGSTGAAPFIYTLF